MKIFVLKKRKFILIPLIAMITLVLTVTIVRLVSQKDLALSAKPFDNVYFSVADEERFIYPAVPPLAGEDIALLQEHLKLNKLYHGAIDGIYAGEIVQAVKKLQQKNGREPDGFLDIPTSLLLAEDKLNPIQKTSNSTLSPPKGDIKIVIDIIKRTLTVFNNEKPYKTFRIAVGKNKTPSPVGEWKVVDKSTNWGRGFGTRWLGLNVPWGIYGIHGTNQPWSIGRSASHGCFRMHNQQVEELYTWIPVNTPVQIIAPLPNSLQGKKFQKDYSGQEIVYLQLRLREKGFETGPADGRFGAQMEIAVRLFQLSNGILDTGVITAEELKLLGFTVD